MKKDNFLSIILILTLIFIVLGSTFSFFRVMVKSDDGAVSMESAYFELKADVIPLYTGNDLLPLNNDDILTAYDNECIDILGNGACSAYTIKIDNFGQNMEYIGNINFIFTELTNLNYMVLDSDGNIYQDITTVLPGTSQSLGDKFILDSGGSNTFTLIVWIPNFDRPQNDDDESGSFNALVSFSSSAGAKVTGTFSS